MFGLSFHHVAQRHRVERRSQLPAQRAVQLNTTDILFAGLDPVSIGGNRPYDNASVLNGQAGQDLHGYRRKEITQLQTTLTHFFDQVMGAERLTRWARSAGPTSAAWKAPPRHARGDPVFGPGPLPGTISGLALPGAEHQHAGHRRSEQRQPLLRERWLYHLGRMGLSRPCDLGLQRRVHGREPQAQCGLVARRRWLFARPRRQLRGRPQGGQPGVDAEYQNTYTASLSYTNFFDGKYTTVDDR